MNDVAISLTLQSPTHARLNILREYCQHYILRMMATHNQMQSLAFVGGTALRVLYNLPRFSEDLDFSALPSEQNRTTDIAQTASQLVSALTKAGYEINSSKTKNDPVVQSTFLKFSGLLQAAQITKDKRRQLSIKLEVDTNPPKGAKTEKSLVTKYMPIAITHFDIPTMMAGKIHAALARPYPKGRDWYDLIWYFTRFQAIVPNFDFLTNALEQRGEEFLPIDTHNFRSKLSEKFASLQWEELVSDFQPFVEDSGDLQMFDKDIFLKVLKG